MSFSTTFEAGGEIVVIQVPKKLDLNNSDEMRKLLKELVLQGKYKWVMDLRKTEYIDSSGLGSFVSQISVCREKNGDIHLAAPSEFVLSLLEITHLNKVLKSFKDIEEAIKAFGEK